MPNSQGFNTQIYTLCKQIPKGKITTYKALAHAMNTRAYRAVGNALRNNPYAPVVPCHRVVASDGTLGGFMGEKTGHTIQKKIQLLTQEGIMIEQNKTKQNNIKNFEEKLFTSFSSSSS